MSAKRIAIVCGVLLAIPFTTSAEILSAGFPPHSLWLSKTNASAGENIRIYTVVYDSGTAAISGTVSFFVDDAVLAQQQFKLASGDSSIISADWTAKEGAHAFTARIDGLKDDRGSPISISNASAESVSLAVSSPAPPSGMQAAITSAQTTFASTTPIALQTASKIANTAEFVRKSAVASLQGALNKNPKSSGFVLGTSTAAETASSGSLFSNIWEAILKALLFICQIQWLFYAAVLAIVYILFKLLRTYLLERRRPNF
ncbi:hypothetical protein HY968_02215 [Candidatus Kaiserbacteria bacterium]|nr:hypothetical protein [Candidatus Kaiserbacteria bacterium]